MKLADLYQGARVYRYWDTGALGASLQPLTVVRVNRVTATVQTDQGSIFRINPDSIEDFWTEED